MSHLVVTLGLCLVSLTTVFSQSTLTATSSGAGLACPLCCGPPPCCSTCGITPGLPRATLLPRVNPSIQALLAFKAEIEPPALASWDSNGSDPCPRTGSYDSTWEGISCTNSSVTALNLSSKNLTGRLSSSLGQISSLQELHLNNNSFSGPIPAELFNLTSLTFLNLDLNKLSGSIPPDLSRMSSLVIFGANWNNLSGNIPPSVGSLRTLRRLYLHTNNLTGRLPPLGSLLLLELIEVSNNHLSGIIPREIGSLSKLFLLNLEDNNFSGRLPEELGSAAALTRLDVSGNQLNGTLPRQLGNLARLSVLDCWGNRFTGPIPKELGELGDLQELYLGNNSLLGAVPAELGDLPLLKVLHLANLNNVTGPLPLSLRRANLTLYMDNSSGLYWPDTSGPGSAPSPIPLLAPADAPAPVIATAPATNTPGPLAAPPIVTPSSPPSPSPSPGNTGLIVGVAVGVSAVLAAILAAILLILCRPSKRGQKGWFLSKPTGKATYALPVNNIQPVYHLSQANLIQPVGEPYTALPVNNPRAVPQPAAAPEWLPGLLRRGPFLLPLSDLWSATRGFSRENELGRGAYGTVYRGQLADGSTVAIKRFHPEVLQASLGTTKLKSELEALFQVRHRNLVQLLGACLDQGEVCLVFAYWPGLSLDRHLHGEGGTPLSWAARLAIARGAANAVAYLHHHTVPQIIHRDIKCANILLNENYEACVTDFGLARIITESVSFKLTSEIAGSAGYIAPEYLYTGELTTKADVFSFGVLLLELVTGQHALDPARGPGLRALVAYVREVASRDEAVVSLLDPILSKSTCPEAEVRAVLAIGLQCTERQPDLRPGMEEVVSQLNQLRVTSRQQTTMGGLVPVSDAGHSSQSSSATWSSSSMVSGAGGAQSPYQLSRGG